MQYVVIGIPFGREGGPGVRDRNKKLKWGVTSKNYGTLENGGYFICFSKVSVIL